MCRLPQDPAPARCSRHSPWRRPASSPWQRLSPPAVELPHPSRVQRGGSCGRSFRRHSLGRQHLHRRNFRRRLRFSGRGIGFLFSRRLRIDRPGRSASSCVTTSEGFSFPFCAAVVPEAAADATCGGSPSVVFADAPAPPQPARRSTLSIPAMICSFFILYLQFLFFFSVLCWYTTQLPQDRPQVNGNLRSCHRKREALWHELRSNSCHAAHFHAGCFFLRHVLPLDIQIIGRQIPVIVTRDGLQRRQ